VTNLLLKFNGKRYLMSISDELATLLQNTANKRRMSLTTLGRKIFEKEGALDEEAIKKYLQTSQ